MLWQDSCPSRIRGWLLAGQSWYCSHSAMDYVSASACCILLCSVHDSGILVLLQRAPECAGCSRMLLGSRSGHSGVVHNRPLLSSPDISMIGQPFHEAISNMLHADVAAKVLMLIYCRAGVTTNCARRRSAWAASSPSPPRMSWRSTGGNATRAPCRASTAPAHASCPSASTRFPRGRCPHPPTVTGATIPRLSQITCTCKSLALVLMQSLGRPCVLEALPSYKQMHYKQLHNFMRFGAASPDMLSSAWRPHHFGVF